MKKITLLDGAIGSNLLEISNGENVYTCNFNCRDIVENLHVQYINAGSKIICANTFSANSLVIKSSDEFTTTEVIKAGVEIALCAAKQKSDVLVALDIGPLTELLEPYGDLTQQKCEQLYKEIVVAGVNAGAQIIFFETFIDLEMMKIALQQAKKYADGLPIFCSMSFTPVGKTIMGQSVLDMIEQLTPFKIDAIGLNCSMQPEQSLKVAQMFKNNTDLPIIFKPNAGLPETTQQGIEYKGQNDFAKEVYPATRMFDNLLLGGCCGSTAQHIKQIKTLLIKENQAT